MGCWFSAPPSASTPNGDQPNLNHQNQEQELPLPSSSDVSLQTITSTDTIVNDNPPDVDPSTNPKANANSNVNSSRIEKAETTSQMSPSLVRRSTIATTSSPNSATNPNRNSNPNSNIAPNSNVPLERASNNILSRSSLTSLLSSSDKSASVPGRKYNTIKTKASTSPEAKIKTPFRWGQQEVLKIFGSKTSAPDLPSFIPPPKKEIVKIPLDFSIVKSLIDKLTSMAAFKEEGLFRISGNFQKVQEVYTTIAQSEPDFSRATAHDIAGVLKFYLRELSTPLIPYNKYDLFIQSSKEQEKEELIKSLRSAFESLPEENLKIMKLILEYLHKVSEYSSINLMTSDNLGIVFGPNVLRKPHLDFSCTFAENSVIGSSIEYFRLIFPEDYSKESKQTLIHELKMQQEAWNKHSLARSRRMSEMVDSTKSTTRHRLNPTKSVILSDRSHPINSNLNPLDGKKINTAVQTKKDGPEITAPDSDRVESRESSEPERSLKENEDEQKEKEEKDVLVQVEDGELDLQVKNEGDKKLDEISPRSPIVEATSQENGELLNTNANVILNIDSNAINELNQEKVKGTDSPSANDVLNNPISGDMERTLLGYYGLDQF
eukprot:TRINITY_DN7784_c0_g1_i1.p1 TRINITY_DN7784_c0_g1~~TRINITY_DN7784_c0_g1_i1.p1  ORF type:complete len:605 (+),score=177.13 TRINITY_DN7784_c0_g1_i1:57-1871(+)